MIEIIDNNNEFVIKQKYQTSLSFDFEGSGFLLEDWKHYNSNWRKIENVGKNKFKIQEYTEEEKNKFPETSPKELKDIFLEYIKKPEYSYYNKELVNNINNINEDPCYIIVTKIFFEIEQKINKNKIIKYYLIIKTPYIP